MASMTDYLENALRDHVLRNISYTPPGTVYLALYTTATSDAGGGTEVVGGGYARQAVTFAAGATPGHGENSATVTFTNMPAVTVTHAALVDAATAGNMLLHGPLPQSKTTQAGDNLTFAAGDVDATFS